MHKVKRCVQCRNPHFDGTCVCGIGPTPKALKISKRIIEKIEKDSPEKEAKARENFQREIDRLNREMTEADVDLEGLWDA